MRENKNSNTNILKCNNCGSTSYKEEYLGVYKCNYCGATFKHEHDDKQHENFFVEFSSSKDGLYYCERTIAKEEFFKKAIMHLALNQNSPDDILSANIEDVRETWGAYLVMSTNYDAIQHKRLSEEETKKVVYSKRVNQCQKLKSVGDGDQEMAILNRLNFLNKLENSQPLTKSVMKKLSILAPADQEVKAEAESLILSYKNAMLKHVGKMATYVEHETESTRVYMVPEYSLEIRYKGQIYKLQSFADEILIVGKIPDESTNVKQQIAKTTAVYHIISCIASIMTIVFAMVFMKLRTHNLYGVQWAFILVSVFVYMLSIVLSKKATNKLMRKRHEQRVKNVETYLQRENITITPLDYDYMNSFKGWC